MTKGNPQKLTHMAEYLRSLGERPPTPELRLEVEGYLSNKWEGIQAVAAQVLGAWGGPESVHVLREFLSRTYNKKYSWSIRGVTVDALAKSVDERDVEWVLDLYFGIEDTIAKHELLPLVSALPVSKVHQRIQQEALGADRDNRQASMKVITRMPFPDKIDLLKQMAGDPDAQIQSVVHNWTERLTHDEPDQEPNGQS